VLNAEVRDRFDHRNINLEVAEFAEGKRIPTSEELAKFIFDRVQAEIGGTARVVEVTVAEDDTMSASYRAD
jgi:6-pyruvoyltetrahydropterin/6-carboxytetrahydropterin synthase